MRLISSVTAAALCISIALTSVPGDAISKMSNALPSDQTAATVSLADAANSAGAASDMSLDAATTGDGLKIAGTTAADAKLAAQEPSTTAAATTAAESTTVAESTAAAEQQAETETAPAEEETVSSDADETTGAQETAPAADTEAEAETEAAADEKTETAADEEAVSMPAVTFSEHTDEEDVSKQMTVSVDAPEGAFPAGTTMTVKPVGDDEILTKAEDAAGLEAGQKNTDEENTTKLLKKKAVEITFHDANGAEIEPQAAIQVSISSDELAEAADKPQIVHVKDDGEAQKVDRIPDEELTHTPAENEVIFRTNEFSVYAVVYTVDFAYGDHSYVLDGDSAVSLSELLDSLKISKDDQGTLLTAEDVADVSFSNPELVSVSRQDGDWELQAQEPFATEETLTLTLKNGDKVEVKVTDDTAADLTPYITEAVAKKLNNGIWEPATSFNDGDTAQIQISYSIPDGIVTQYSPSVTYTLPDGVTVIEAVTGKIKRTSDGQEVGTYTISTDGRITLTFDKDRIGDGKGFDGDVQFTSTVHNTSDEENKEISFGGSSSTITIHKPQESKYDVSVSKTGSLSDDEKTMNYTITAPTEKGTEGTVTIRDAVNRYESYNTSFAYDKNSITVYKVSADGIQSPVSSDQYTLNFDGTGTDSQFAIDNLPQLSAGEKYIVTYSAAVGVNDSSQTAKITNSAGAKSGTIEKWSYSSKEIYPSVLKSGQYDAENDRINWTITLNQGKTADVSKWVISDTTPDEIIGNVIVQDGDGNTISTITNLSGGKQLDVKMADCLGNNDKNGTYYIRYATKVTGGTPGEAFTKTNTATVKEGNTTIQTATGTVNDKYREADVHKTYRSTDTSDLISGKLRPGWRFDVQVPAGELKSFTYTDTIGPVTDADGNEIAGAQHYGTAAAIDKKLQGHLKLKIDDTVQYVYAAENSTLREAGGPPGNESSDVRIRVHYYAGTTEVQASDENTHIDKFVVEVVTLNNTSFTARKLTLDNDYYTTIDISNMKEGATWTVGNTGSAFNKNSKAEYSYTKPERFVKQVYQKDKEGKEVYETGSSTVNYDKMNGELKYRLLLSTTEADNGTIVVTDTLPAGTSLVEDSLKAQFFVNENYSSDDNYNGTNFKEKSKPQVTSVKNDDGTTALTIKLPGYTYSANYPQVAITYRISIADDPAWEDLTRTQQKYENHAIWGGSTSSTETTVKREREKIIKSGEQLTDGDGNYTNRIRYTVDINPGGLDLDVDSNTLTLTDTLSGADRLNPVLDISSLKLCNYDPDKADHVGSELAKTSYTLDYDESKAALTMKIPDSKALVLIYEYSLDESYGDGYPVSNSVSLNGKSASKTELKLQAQSSSSHASRAKITVYKVDSRNNQIPLPGTAFRLEQFDTATKEWTDKGQKTTDEEGKLEWSVSGSTPELTADTLYRLIETKALPGYQLDNSPHYLIWKGAASTDDTAYAAADAGSANVQKNDITFVSHTGGILYIRNTYTRVGVQKVWTNPDGSEAQAPDDVSVQVQLYRQNLTPNGHTVNITATSTSPGSNNKKNLSYIVKDGTSLTIKFQYWNDSKPLYVKYDGKKEEMILTKETGWYTYTFPSVTDDLNVIIEVEAYDPNQQLQYWNIEYTNAPNTVSNRKAVGDPVTLVRDSDTGKLSKEWDNLEQQDAEGNQYYYTVEEVSVTRGGKSIAGDYTTTYSNNDGIQSGQIIITNTQKEKPEEYVLPESGGSGAQRYIGAGALLIMAAGILYITLRQKRRKGQI